MKHLKKVIPLWLLLVLATGCATVSGTLEKTDKEMAKAADM